MNDSAFSYESDLLIPFLILLKYKRTVFAEKLQRFPVMSSRTFWGEKHLKFVYCM